MNIEHSKPASRMRLLYCAAVLALLVVLVAELQLSIRHLSQTYDEGAHLYAGYEHWTAHDFGVNPEHPPLVKMVAALPLLGMKLTQPHAPNILYLASENIGGSQLLYNNDANALLWRGRTAASLFTVLLAVLIFFAGYEMFGPLAGLLALALVTFEPTLLGHGALVTTDIGVTAFIFASVYAFYRYVKLPDAARLLVFAMAVGLALVSKLSGVLVFPVLLVLTAVELSSQWSTRRAMQLLGGIAFAVVLGYGMIWTFYGFHYARPNGLEMVPTLAQFVTQLPSATETSIVMHLARWRVLPEAYLYGWTKLPIDQAAHPMFLLGRIFGRGQWFYFPVALLIKTSLTVLLLAAVAPLLYMRQLRPFRREMIFLGASCVVLLLMTMTSHLDIGVRHALPIYPFLLMLAAASAWALTKMSRVGQYVVAALLLFQVASSLWAYPDYLAYSNEAFGGTSRTYRLLADSNVDWGQQLIEVNDYLTKNHVQQCWFSYALGFNAPPQKFGIPCKPLPAGFDVWAGMPQPVVPAHIDGVVLLPTNEYAGTFWGGGDLNPYRQILDTQPVALIGHSVLVYRGSYDIPLAAAQAQFTQSTTFLRMGKPVEALAAAKQAAEMAPESAAIQVELGALLLSMHQKAAAEEAFSKARELAKAHLPAQQQQEIEEKISAAVYWQG